jgi:hypothetical protein
LFHFGDFGNFGNDLGSSASSPLPACLRHALQHIFGANLLWNSATSSTFSPGTVNRVMAN